MKLNFAFKQDSRIISIKMNGAHSSQVFPVFQLFRTCEEVTVNFGYYACK